MKVVHHMVIYRNISYSKTRFECNFFFQEYIQGSAFLHHPWDSVHPSCGYSQGQESDILEAASGWSLPCNWLVFFYLVICQVSFFFCLMQMPGIVLLCIYFSTQVFLVMKFYKGNTFLHYTEWLIPYVGDSGSYSCAFRLNSFF